MPILLNPRHERFAQGLADGKSASEAYVVAGFKANRGNATTLKQQESVSKRVAEIFAERDAAQKATLAAAIERSGIDKAWVMERLQDVAERCLTAEPVKDHEGEPTGEYTFQAAGANRALELIGKELGMFIDRKEVRTGPLDAKSDAELDDLIRRLAAEAGLGDRVGGEGAADEGKPASGLPSVH